MTKALVMAKGNELDTLLSKARDDIMRVLFGGGVIRGRKLQRGSVLTFADVDTQFNGSVPSKDAILRNYERIQLFQKAFPVESLQAAVQEGKTKYGNLLKLQGHSASGGYWDSLTAVDKPTNV
jgi:ribosome-associated protein YbcJ (S4-like RNA binding protein)